MSIPPLVCSTPPPPDQCVEDNEHDDFDINYSLSQDDDDEPNYKFCSFSNVTSKEPICHDDSSIPPLSEGFSGSKDNINDVILNKECDNDYDLSKSNQSYIKTEEDNTIEDLDLRLEQLPVTIIVNEDEPVKKDLDSVIEELSPTRTGNNTTESSPSLSSGIGTSFSENVNIQEPSDETKSETRDDFINEINPNENEEVTVVNSKITPDNQDSSNVFPNTTDNSDNVFQYTMTEMDTIAQESLSDTLVTEIKKSDIDQPDTIPDDDFDDFKFVNTLNTEAAITTSEFTTVNPWDNDNSDDTFGEFRANFDDFKDTVAESIEKPNASVEGDGHGAANNEVDDDFGDFDDFKSCSAGQTQTQAHHTTSHVQHSVFSMQSSHNETQYLESVTKVIESLFEEELKEPEVKLERSLESSLCETWGHLLDIDVRQPYMVTWNNSLGQKSLLRALCIDSRNILFGPKWTNNMPRYAAKLDSTPMQPLKQISGSHTTSTVLASSDKNTLENWPNSLSTNEQESSTTINRVNESRHNETGTNTTKSDKDYPTALNIQPICQINLPDTHIFTPTDSETPRSKTIHYDSAPSILKPEIQETASDHKLSDYLQTIDTVEDDYSEFQDFKGARVTAASNVLSNSISTNTLNSSPNISYQTKSILQPVRLEPMIPVLNWPDPGEVKETFNDFSDFVSNSSWFDDKKDNIGESKNITVTDRGCIDVNVGKVPDVESTLGPNVNGLDDDFDNFQSAAPPKQVFVDNIKQNVDILNQIPGNNDPFNFPLPQMQNSLPPKSNIVNQMLPENNLQINTQLDFRNHSNDASTTLFEGIKNIPTVDQSLSMSSQVLQPTPASTVQQKHNTTQILQPLSLESISQIKWPNPGLDWQDLSRFNPIEKVHSLKSETRAGGPSKVGSPAHSSSQLSSEDGWGDFVSSKPKPHNSNPKSQVPVEDDDWSDFVSSPVVRTHNGLNTISLNVHTNSNIQKSGSQSKQRSEHKQMDIPTLNYITPKTNSFRSSKVSNQQFQNL